MYSIIFGLFISKLLIATQNITKKDNIFMNSELPNWPKPAQILDYVP